MFNSPILDVLADRVVDLGSEIRLPIENGFVFPSKKLGVCVFLLLTENHLSLTTPLSATKNINININILDPEAKPISIIDDLILDIKPFVKERI